MLAKHGVNLLRLIEQVADSLIVIESVDDICNELAHINLAKKKRTHSATRAFSDTALVLSLGSLLVLFLLLPLYTTTSLYVSPSPPA